ncbi:hypothetical protein F4054_10320 [Candidatus Poribacteria bacterium]|nr:hypothetical protein [Candidatus Poribacteria bacterium]MYG08528.1 hypothetical protein [Candidatus Poribacteria bacterium]MYK22641.1 hypothetical protein [Candidatus Poribacteria bacterium]
MKRLLRPTAAVLTVLTYVLLMLSPGASSHAWVESTTPNPNELPSTSGQVVVFNFSISHDYEVSVRYQAQVWNGYLGEDAMTINYEAKYRISVYEPQQNGTIKRLFYSNTNSGSGTIGSGSTFHGHNSASYDASGLPDNIDVVAEASTEVTVHALDDDNQVIQSKWSVSDSISWTMPRRN